MKKSYFIIAALVVCTSLPIALTSCGSKDDEQEVINNSNSVMKMELWLSRKEMGKFRLSRKEMGKFRLSRKEMGKFP